MQVSAIIDECRDLLQDQVVPYRYDTDQLERFVTFAVREAKRIRPDLFLGSFANPIDDLTSSNPFPMPDEYAPTVANFAVSRAEFRDDEFTVDGRAVALLKLYQQQLLSVA